MSLIAVGASSNQRRERRARTVGNRDIAADVLAGVVRNAFIDPGAHRSSFLTNIWIELKRFGARGIPNVELSRIRGIDRVRVDGPVRRHSPMVLTALAILLESETVFEFGPDTGDTGWLLAHNLDDASIYMFDEGPVSHDRTESPASRVHHLTGGGDRRRDATTPSSRIIQLSGDSTTFDFSQYSGTADLVYIERRRRESRLGSDTEAAFGLLSELGTIVWDGYSGDAGVYSFLNELAPSLDRPIYHILGTRLALYSRWDLVIPDVG